MRHGMRLCSGLSRTFLYNSIMKEIIISSLEEGQRLDRVLQRCLPRASSGFVYKMLRKKNITLNGKKADGRQKLRAGDTVRIYFSDETLDKFAPPAGTASWPRTSLDIVYEDDQVLLINKPAGMLSQKASPSDVSLNEYAIGYLLDSGALSDRDLESFRPSVCNRLDRNTSGIVAVGKTTAALRELSSMFRDRTVHKFYYALVSGRLDEGGCLDAYLEKDKADNKVRIIPAAGVPEYNIQSAGAGGEDGPLSGSEIHDGSTGEHPMQRIRTRYTPVAHRSDGADGHELTLLEVELITGRPHQIRAHLSFMGYPVVGDPKYGSRRRNEYFQRVYGLKYQLLHAGRLVFAKEDGELGYLCGREYRAAPPGIFERILREEEIWRHGIQEGFGEAPWRT